MNLLRHPLKRRDVAKGLGLASLATLAFTPVLGWQKSSPKTSPANSPGATATALSMVLISRAGEQQSFLRGVQAAWPASTLPVTDTAAGMGYLDLLSQLLSRQQPTRVIGLVDNASAALVVAAARRHGARVSWLGQHAGEEQHSRHTLLNASITRDCAAQWARAMHSCGVSYELHASAAHSRQPELQMRSPEQTLSSKGEWSSSLGYALASIDHASPLPTPSGLPSAALRGQFVSFVIEA